MRCFKSECRSAGVSGETLHRQEASQLPPPTDIHWHSFPRGILSRIDHKTFFHFHARFVSQRPRRPSFPALLSSGRNKTRKEEKELSFLSFQLLTYFPLTKNLQFLFLLFFFFSHNWSAANGTSRQVNRRSQSRPPRVNLWDLPSAVPNALCGLLSPRISILDVWDESRGLRGGSGRRWVSERGSAIRRRHPEESVEASRCHVRLD